MNITLTLFKRGGLTKEQVNDLTGKLRDDIENLGKELRKTEGNVAFWKSQMKKRAAPKKCTKCKGLINLWPFEDYGYELKKGGKVKHLVCPTKDTKDGR